MKIFVTILFLLAGFVSFSQPIVFRAGPANTTMDANPWAQRSFRPPVYNDTTQANTLYTTLDSCGKIIYTYETHGFWYRSCEGGVKHWVQLTGGGGGTVTGAQQGLSLNGANVELGATSNGAQISGTRRINGKFAGTVGGTTFFWDSLNFITRQRGVETFASRALYTLISANVSNAAYTQYSDGLAYTLGRDSIVLGGGGTPFGSPTYIRMYGFDSSIRISSKWADQYATDSLIWRTDSRNTHLSIYEDSMVYYQGQGEHYVYRLDRETDTTGLDLMAWNRSTWKWVRIPSTLVGSAIPISSLLAATGTNSISNNTFTQTWDWNGLRTGAALSLRGGASASSTTGEIKILEAISQNVTISDGNTVNAIYAATTNNSSIGFTSTARSGYFSAEGAASGGTLTNIGLQASATNGTNNYAIIVPSGGGNVGIGTSAPAAQLDVTANSAGLSAVSITNSSATGSGLTLSVVSTTTHQLINLAGGSGANSRFRIEANGEVQFNGSAGTSGQVLTSAGNDAPPTWQTLSSSVTWNGIADPTGSQALTFADGELTTWDNQSNTETFFTIGNNSLTTGTAWNSATNSMTSGTLFELISTSTALASGNELINLSMSGANGTSSIIATPLRISVTNTGTTSTNRGIEVTASGATNNTAIHVGGGQVLAATISSTVPGIASTGDTDTGIDFPTGNILAVILNSVREWGWSGNSMQADANGVVGFNSTVNGPFGAGIDVGLSRNAAGVLEANNGTPGTIRDMRLRKLFLTTGANTNIGTATLSAGTVTVNTTQVTASSIIFLTYNTPSGTTGQLSAPVASISAGTSFVINSSSGTDASTVNYIIIN